MIRVLRTVVVMAALGMAIAVVAAAALFAFGDPSLAHAVITIDGEQVRVGQMQGSVALVAVLVIVVVLVILLVLPFAVLLPIVATALALFLVLLAVAGTAALALSPFILIGWVFWRVARPRPRPMAQAPMTPR